MTIRIVFIEIHVIIVISVRAYTSGKEMKGSVNYEYL